MDAPPQIIEGTKTEVDNVESEADNDDILAAFGGDVEVNNVDPLPTLTLDEARVHASRLLEFVVANNEFVKKVGPKLERGEGVPPYIRRADVGRLQPSRSQ